MDGMTFFSFLVALSQEADKQVKQYKNLHYLQHFKKSHIGDSVYRWKTEEQLNNCSIITSRYKSMHKILGGGRETGP